MHPDLRKNIGFDVSFIETEHILILRRMNGGNTPPQDGLSDRLSEMSSVAFFYSESILQSQSCASPIFHPGHTDHVSDQVPCVLGGVVDLQHCCRHWQEDVRVHERPGQHVVPLSRLPGDTLAQLSAFCGWGRREVRVAGSSESWSPGSIGQFGHGHR